MDFSNLAYVLLAWAAVFSIRRRGPPLALSLAFAIGVGLSAQLLEPVSLVWIVLLAVFGIGATRFSSENRWSHGMSIVNSLAFLALSVSLFMHRLPGFQNKKIFDRVLISAEAIPFSMHFNFDKTIAGIAIAALFLPVADRSMQTPDRSGGRDFVLAFLGLIAVSAALALPLGYVRWEPKLPQQWWLWFINNLFFVCFAEECLFRGLIQGQLCKKLSVPGTRWMAVAAGALTFGLAHYQGGWAYVGLASVAGLFYGFIYERSGRIELSILLHFSLNATHFFLFTYPALA